MVERLAARSHDASGATAEIPRGQLGYDPGEIAWTRLEVSGELSATAAAAERILAKPADQATSA